MKMKMKEAFKVLSKNLYFDYTKQKKITKGLTDGQIRRFNQKKNNLHNTKVKEIMTKNPIGIDKNALAAKALSIMNTKK